MTRLWYAQGMTTFLYTYDNNDTGVVEERLTAIMAQQKPALEAACRGEVFKYEKPAKYFLYLYNQQISKSQRQEIIDDRLHALRDSLQEDKTLYVISGDIVTYHDTFGPKPENVSWYQTSYYDHTIGIINELPHDATICVIAESIGLSDDCFLGEENTFWRDLFRKMPSTQTLHLLKSYGTNHMSMVERSPASFVYGHSGWVMKNSRYGKTAKTIREVREALKLAALGQTYY